MADRPILFSGAMVRALLTGTKTQTRRVAKPVRHPDLGNVYAPGALVLEREPQHVIDRACPYGQPCDHLWVRETWQHSNHPYGPYDEDCMVFYRADFLDDIHGPDGEKSSEGRYRFWRPSIHMPRTASRITLEVTSVRVERLQSISAADAIAEGVNVHPDHHDKPRASIYGPVQAYRDLWEQINGSGSWDVDPWVWRLEFKRVMTGLSHG